MKSGEEHKCSPKKESISNIQQHMPKKMQEQLSSKILKDKAEASGSKSMKLSTFGNPLTVSIGATKSDNPEPFTHEDIIAMKRDMHLSGKNTLKMAQHLRDKSLHDCFEHFSKSFSIP